MSSAATSTPTITSSNSNEELWAEPPPKRRASSISLSPTTSLIDGVLTGPDCNTYSVVPQPLLLLPPACTGALGLKIPELIKGPIANIVLPSRLATLGRQSYQLLAALSPINLGNSVVGWSYVRKRHRLKRELFVLPWIFSKSAARIAFFLRFLLLLVFLVFFFQFAQIFSLNVGRAWFFGSAIAIYVMYRLALFRRAPDGVMAFCRSLGPPDIEEYMFSYSWKVEPDAVRTLAKALWNTGVGAWVDIVKLCPGDEIRPVVRTMMNRVYRCVVFLSPAYISSPNCCVEFHEAVQWPQKLIICIMQDVEGLEGFLERLKRKGAIIVRGIDELITRLDYEICDVNDAAAWRWWRRQRITPGGVPSHVVPAHWHTIPKYSWSGSIKLPPRSLYAGPVYLSGDCKNNGMRFLPPYLFILSLMSVTANFVDLYFTFRNANRRVLESETNYNRVDSGVPTLFTNEYITPSGALASTGTYQPNNIYVQDKSVLHTGIDYVWLFIMGCCNFAPFSAWSHLFETRTDVHPVLRPLLASKSMHGGVKIRVVGEKDDPIADSLHKFMVQIGHSSETKEEENNTATTAKHTWSVAGEPAFQGIITVYVMRNMEMRNELFGNDVFPFDPKTSLFIWSDPKGDPFTKDEIGERLMRFLVLVAAWDRKLLAENLFSAIGVRVVDMLHSNGKENQENQDNKNVELK